MVRKKVNNIRFRNLCEKIGGYGLPAWLLTEGAFKFYSLIESNPNMSDTSRNWVIAGAILTLPVWPQIMVGFNNTLVRTVKYTNGAGRLVGYHTGNLIDVIRKDKSKRKAPTMKELFKVDKDLIDPYEKWHEMMDN